MKPANLGYATELTFPLFDGEVLERDEYWAIRTPENPGYYWGNFLLFRTAPTLEDLSRWPALFAREFPDTKHCALGWDGIDGDPGAAAAFVDAGYTFQDELVQCHRGVAQPAVPPEGFVLDRMAGPDEALNIASDDLDGKADVYAVFKATIRARYRAMVADERGCWFGARSLSSPELVVSQLGIFRAPDGRARFQSVETHPDLRRRGISRALVNLALHTAIDEFGAREVVVVADPAYHAAEMYRQQGFADQYPIHGVYRAPLAGASRA